MDEMTTSPYYLELQNDPETFAELATVLIEQTSVAFRWRDGLGSAMTVCMSLPVRKNYIPGTAMLTPYLFVGIEGYGMHPFEVNPEVTHDSYFREKLFGGRNTGTVNPVADLINGVKKELYLR